MHANLFETVVIRTAAVRGLRNGFAAVAGVGQHSPANLSPVQRLQNPRPWHVHRLPKRGFKVASWAGMYDARRDQAGRPAGWCGASGIGLGLWARPAVHRERTAIERLALLTGRSARSITTRTVDLGRALCASR